MKSKIIFSIVFLVTCSALFSADPLEVKTRVKEVTVYLNGAQVTRLSGIEIPKGSTVLAFRNLPENIDPQSIQVKGQGRFTVLSVMHQINYLTSQRKSREVLAMEDSLAVLEEKLALNNGMLQVYKSEEDLLAANMNIGSDEKGVIISELKMAADFLRSRITEIKRGQLAIAKENAALNERINKLRNQLNTINTSLSKPTSEILVTVDAAASVSGDIKLTYTVFNAGWFPVYDIRAVDVANPVSLAYNAKVFQHTGEDWENVKLKLSTADPRQRGDKPNLTSWYLDFSQTIGAFGYENVMAPSMAKRAEMPRPAATDQLMETAIEETASTAANYTMVSQHQTNLEFSIKIPYDIPSDYKQYTINIQEYSLPATYQYYCAPKLDRDAFLIARVTGWEDFNLLSGEINLFFEDTYVGKSILNVRSTSDTLDLSLGRDKNIVITRIRLADYTADKTFGGTRQETRGWEISVRNNKKQPVRLMLEDQFPVSMNKEIQVEPVEYSGGAFNKETGKIQWLLDMAPSQDKKLKAVFTVKYPQDREVFID